MSSLEITTGTDTYCHAPAALPSTTATPSSITLFVAEFLDDTTTLAFGDFTRLSSHSQKLTQKRL